MSFFGFECSKCGEKHCNCSYEEAMGLDKPKPVVSKEESKLEFGGEVYHVGDMYKRGKDEWYLSQINSQQEYSIKLVRVARDSYIADNRWIKPEGMKLYVKVSELRGEYD